MFSHNSILQLFVLQVEDLKQYLSIDEYRLYKLIYNRTLASLMAPAVFNSTKVEFTNTDSKWTVSGQMLEFVTFAVYIKNILLYIRPKDITFVCRRSGRSERI